MNSNEQICVKQKVEKSQVTEIEISISKNSGGINCKEFTDREYVKQELLHDIDINQDGLLNVKNLKQEVKMDIEYNKFTDKVDAKEINVCSREAVKIELPEELNVIKQEVLICNEDIKQEMLEMTQNINETKDIKGARLTEKCSVIGTHITTHTVEYKPYMCNKCQQGFTELIDLSKHLKIHSVKKSFGCDKCQEKFTCKTDLMIHMSTHFKQQGSADESNLKKTHTEVKLFACEKCQEKFAYKSNLSKHMRKHEAKLKTNLTKHEAKLKTNLTKHEALKTNLTKHDSKLKTNYGKPFMCQICLQELAHKSDLDDHLAKHSREKLLKCEKCPRRFKKQYRLDIHLKEHTEHRPYVPVCEQRIENTTELNTLTKTVKEDSFQCKICRRSFKRRINLNKHLITHSGEKHFKCVIC